MKYGKIENYKVVGTCITESKNYPDTIPDGAELFDYLVGDELFKAADYQNKIISVVKGVVTWSDDMEKLSAAKLSEIADAFSEAIKNGSFVSASLGINVDCRRSNTKNDYQNVQGLLSRMNRDGIESVTYIGVSELVTATKAQIQALLYEMEDHVAALYAKKWALEAQIEAATTADELRTIVW